MSGGIFLRLFIASIFALCLVSQTQRHVRSAYALHAHSMMAGGMLLARTNLLVGLRDSASHGDLQSLQVPAASTIPACPNGPGVSTYGATCAWNVNVTHALNGQTDTGGTANDTVDNLNDAVGEARLSGTTVAVLTDPAGRVMDSETAYWKARIVGGSPYAMLTQWSVGTGAADAERSETAGCSPTHPCDLSETGGADTEADTSVHAQLTCVDAPGHQTCASVGGTRNIDQMRQGVGWKNPNQNTSGVSR